jgi:hypothetical protein
MPKLTEEAIANMMPMPGSVWRHYNNSIYTVLHIANEPDDERYPATVVYQGTNGKVWARRLDDWHRSMTFTGPSVKLTPPTNPPDWTPPVLISDKPETLTPTYRLRWSRYGLLEQLFLGTDNREHWKPVPRE